MLVRGRRFGQNLRDIAGLKRRDRVSGGGAASGSEPASERSAERASAAAGCRTSDMIDV